MRQIPLFPILSALLAACVTTAAMAAPPDRQAVAIDGASVEAVVELNYYVHEPAAAIVFDLSDVQATGHTARVVLARPGQEDLTAESAVADHGPTRVSLPIRDLDQGRYPVTLSLSRNGHVRWQGTDTLVKLAPPKEGIRLTQIDRYRRIILVDGEPLFPMGVFGVYPEYLQEVADAGFNMTLRWKGATKLNRWNRELPWDSKYNSRAVDDYLNAVHAAGMYAVETPVKLAEEALYHRFRDIPTEYAKGPYWHDKYPIHNEQITPGVIRNARDHPAVIGYYNYDEPDNFYPDTPDHPKHLLMQEGVEEWYDIVKELDPYHAVMTLFAVGLSKVEDWDAWDVAMRDYYIYRDKHMSEVYNVARESAEVAWRLHTPFVMTPLFEKSSGRPVPLSAAEQRAQTYLVLAADVKGLFYWDWPAAYAPNWEMLKQLAREVDALSSILLERAPEQNVRYTQADRQNAVKTLIKNHGGKTYLIAVNAEPAPVDVSFKLPSSLDGTATVWFENRSLNVANGILQDTFEPYGRHVYELAGGTWPSGGTLQLSTAVSDAPALVDPEFGPTRDNLLTNTSFEYDYARVPGWPVDWHPQDSIMQAGQVAADGGRWTPVTDDAYHGKRSLRMIKSAPGIGGSDDLYNLMTVPAVQQDVRYPKAGTYTLSMYMKADQPSEVWVLNGWQGHSALQVGTQWQRYEIPIKRGSEGRSFIRLALMEQGTLWVDAVQLQPGERASDYAPAEPTNRQALD